MSSRKQLSFAYTCESKQIWNFRLFSIYSLLSSEFWFICKLHSVNCFSIQLLFRNKSEVCCFKLYRNLNRFAQLWVFLNQIFYIRLHATEQSLRCSRDIWESSWEYYHKLNFQLWFQLLIEFNLFLRFQLDLTYENKFHVKLYLESFI